MGDQRREMARTTHDEAPRIPAAERGVDHLFDLSLEGGLVDGPAAAVSRPD